AIEFPNGAAEIEAIGDLVVSLDGEPAQRIGSGARLRVAVAPRAVRYLAVTGGLDVPVVLGARATLVAARLGGLDGRPLRKGEVLAGGGATLTTPALSTAPLELGSPVVLDADPGPHADRLGASALEALASASFLVSPVRDRVGVRLDGARVPRRG